MEHTQQSPLWRMLIKPGTHSLEAPIHFLPFSLGAVIYKEGTNNFSVLNSSAAYICCLLLEGMDSDETAHHLSKKFNIQLHNAQSDVASVNNILNKIRATPLFSNPFPTSINQTTTKIQNSLHSQLEDPQQWDFQKYFNIHNFILNISCQTSEPVKHFASLLQHFSIPYKALPNTKIAVKSSCLHPRNYDIYIDTHPYVQNVSPKEVLPHLLALTFTRTCQFMQNKLLFHAAVVAKNNETILFPAESGSGKTTLIAALVNSGLTYFSDEIAAINTRSGRVSPFLFPMTIKQGSVDILKPLFSALSKTPVYLRPDGKLVRYLMLYPRQLPHSEAEATIRAIIFPAYHPKTKHELLLLSKEETIHKLAETGTSGRILTCSDIQTLIHIADHTTGYILKYRSLQRACDTVHTLYL